MKAPERNASGRDAALRKWRYDETQAPSPALEVDRNQGDSDDFDQSSAQPLLLESATRRRGDLEKELIEGISLAEHMQHAMLPSPDQLMMLAESSGIRIASHSRPSALLSGDIWGLFDLGSKGMGVFIADFCGHGISAALNTVRLHTLLQGMQEHYDQPDRLLGGLNRQLVNLLPTGDFATMWYGVLDVEGDCLRYAAAGSPPALLFGPDRTDILTLDCSGVPLGISPDVQYDLRIAPCPPETSLLLCSDALDEPSAMQARSIADVVRTLTIESGPREFIRALCQEILGEASVALDDDLTVVCLRR